MDNKKFEKRRKGVEIIFDIIFWFNLISLIVSIAFKIFYLTGKASVDTITYQELAINVVTVIFIFVCSRLAHKGNIAAGIIGVIIAILEIMLAGILWKLIGVLLLIDSIMYLINYKKQ